MSGFYALAPDEQVARLLPLARVALARWDVEPQAIDLLKYRENAVFAVTDTRGARVVLRIHRAGYHTDAELRSEYQWMQALDAAGIRTPPLLPARDGRLFHVVAADGVPEPRQVDVLGWVEGRQLGSVEEGIAGDAAALARVHRTLGALAARVHVASAAWERPPGFTRHAWDAAGLVGDDPWWGRFWELAPLTAPQRRLIESARAHVAERLDAFGQAPDRYGLIHADFLPENLLAGDDGTIYLIDFDDAGFGWYLFELATPLFFHATEPHWEAVRDATVAGYREQRPLPDAHVALLPTFVLARGLSYLAWVHTRRETETARALTPLLVAMVCDLAARELGAPAAR
jgi:Ser/Thr protein kinase RdoA (MazF antagonist)